MGFILPPILFLGIVALAIWWLFFRAAVRHERTVREARQREAEFERLLTTPDEPLYCVSCQQVFRGPLDDLGCSTCLTRAFVIPVRSSNDPRILEKGRRLPVPQRLESPAHTEASRTTPEDTPSKEIIPQGNKRL